MRAKLDQLSEIQSIFLEKDEIANMLLDGVFGLIDAQIWRERVSCAASGRPSSSPACATETSRVNRVRKYSSTATNF